MWTSILGGKEELYTEVDKNTRDGGGGGVKKSYTLMWTSIFRRKKSYTLMWTSILGMGGGGGESYTLMWASILRGMGVEEELYIDVNKHTQ